jgi:hypothetical protein
MSKQRELPTASLSLHPEAGVVPEMPEDQFKLFLADIEKNGIEDPLAVLPGTKIVIRGRTRLRAANVLNLPSVPVVDADLRGQSPAMYMIRDAVLRRQLTKDQRAALAAEIEEDLTKAAKERQREGGKKGAATAGRGRPKQGDNGVVANSPQPKPAPKSRDTAAAIAGAKPRAVSDAKKLKKVDPKGFEQVKAGTVTLAAAKNAAGITTPKKDPAPSTQPAGTPLDTIQNFPTEALAPLALKGVRTVEDLDEQLAALRKERGRSSATRTHVLSNLIPENTMLAWKAGDALIDHFGPTKQPPKPPPAPKPSDTPHELKPCPFCESSNVEYVKGLGMCVMCHECGSNGPRKTSEVACCVAWNKAPRAKK